jgi:hypothetical protein
MIKWCIRTLLILLSIVIAIQLYWYLVYNGNVVIYIIYQNNQKVESKMSIELNEEIVYQSSLIDTSPSPYQSKICLNRLGRYKMVFERADLQEKKEVPLNIWGMRWIVIDAFSKKTRIQSHLTPPLFQ